LPDSAEHFALSPGEVLAYLAAGRSLDRAIFEGVDLRGRTLKNVSLRGAVLYDVDLSDADLSGADLSSATFSSVNLERARAEAAVMKDASFMECRAGEIAFSECDLSNVICATSSLRDRGGLVRRWTTRVSRTAI
jgi:uncharacterized protein YjbI with pentapeptide repeats